MNRYIVIIIFLLPSLNIFAQTNWHFEPKIERNTYYLLEGSIADKYPITMYLEYGNFCLHYSRWDYAKTLKGWYYYNNKKIKLPLIGSEKYYQTDEGQKEQITLYVPTNVLDTIRENSCDLEKYNEIFVADAVSFEEMQWQMNNSKSFLPVKLKEKSRPSAETKSSILLYVKGIEMFSFNLTDNSKDVYIETIELKASKEIGNDFYLIFSFSRPSKPSSLGMGHCGSGYEDYLGFLHISSFEVKEFKYVQTYSCFSAILEEYTFEKNAPEKGITVTKNE